MKITKKMIDIYHKNQGEDFVDYNSALFNPQVLTGFFLAKRPNLANKITKAFNENINKLFGFTVQDLQEVFIDDDNDFYEVLVEYINLASESLRQQVAASLYRCKELRLILNEAEN